MITAVPVMTPVISLPTWSGNVYILLYIPVLSDDYVCCLLLSCTYNALRAIDIIPVILVVTMATDHIQGLYHCVLITCCP